jgi:hypothetical protein
LILLSYGNASCLLVDGPFSHIGVLNPFVVAEITRDFADHIPICESRERIALTPFTGRPSRRSWPGFTMKG